MADSGANISRRIFQLGDYGPRLWTRDLAREIREDLEKVLDSMPLDSLLVLDCSKVEVFDFSFASELFAKMLLRLPSEYPGRYMVISGLQDYTRENLDVALRASGVMAVETKGRGWNLLGKYSPSDRETLGVLKKARHPLGAPDLAKTAGINVTAANERLVKLAKAGLVKRQESGAGRIQLLYSSLV